MNGRLKTDGINRIHIIYIGYAVLLMSIYSLIYIYSYDNGSYLIFDNLDSFFVYYRILISSGHVFSPNHSVIDSIMNGVPRGSLPSEFNFTYWLYYLLGPLNSYIFERIISLVVGFFGMYLLLSRYIIPHKKYHIIQIGISLSFAMLPHFPYGGMSVAGLPFIMFAYLNFRHYRDSIFDWIIVLNYSLYSSFQLVGFFLIILLGLLFLFDLIARGKINFRFFIAVAFLLILYQITHYRLWLNFLFDQDYISHRIEFSFPRVDIRGLKGSFNEAKNIFINGHLHARSFHDLIVIPFVLLSVLLMWERKILDKRFWFIIIFMLFSSIFYGLSEWHRLSFVFGYINQVFPMQLRRFFWLHPLLWYLLFALSLSNIYNYFRIGKYIIIFALIFQSFYVLQNHELIRYRHNPTFREFFAERQFADIKEFIGRPSSEYRVVSLGIHPSITQYSGFYTLDGYLTDYPLSYKHLFRNIIEGELNKYERASKYYDNWGSRAYIFIEDNFWPVFRKNNSVILDALDLDYSLMKELNCEYIFSAVQINTENVTSCRLMKVFHDETSAWRIYLYEILPDS